MTIAAILDLPMPPSLNAVARIGKSRATGKAFVFSDRRNRRDPTAPLSPSEAAKLLMLLKLARSENGQHNNDDYIDMAGYAAIAGELEGRGL